MELNLDGTKVNNCAIDTTRDYSGTTFCHLTVIAPRSVVGKDIISYDCKCEKCGKLIVVNITDLFFYKTRSCGCTDFLDLTGGIFSNLKVIRSAGSKRLSSGQLTKMWLCKCKCGREIVVRTNSLTTRHSKSCGCLRISQATKFIDPIDRKINHRFSIIKDRCYNPNCNEYWRYGGNGVYVCDEWMKDTKNFVNWFRSQPNWSLKLEVDRINGKGPYSPDNCRLASRETQLINRNSTHFVVVDGIKLTGSQWSFVLKLKNRCSLYSFMQYHTEQETIEMIRSKMLELGINKNNVHNFIQFEHFDPITKENNHV